MGLPRPPEPFHRVYSPPEPPATARRTMVGRRGCLTLLLAAVAFAVAAVVAFVLLPGGKQSRTAKPPPVASEPGAGSRPSATGPSEEPSSAPTPPPTTPPPTAAPQTPVFTSLPPPCAAVSEATVRRLVPGAKITKSANTTFASCAYSSPGQGFRWLQVESRLYASANTATPVQDAHRLFGVQWSLAGRATEERTVSLRRQTGLGDEAYRWFKVDERQPTAIGVVAARLRNVVITVSYSEQTASKKGLGAQEQRCLAEAAAVAREVLADLS